MFEFVVAASIALSTESVDGIFGKRSSSCSSGSCSAAPAVEKKPEIAAVKKEEPAKACSKPACSTSPRRGTFLGRIRKCS